MSTSTADVAPVVSQEPPTDGQQPAHRVCWLYTAKKVSGDIYTGVISSMKLVGNKLSLCLEPITRVQECDGADDVTKAKHWRSLSPIKTASFEFEGCTEIAEKSDANRLVYVSSTGDTIILSNKTEDVQATESLFIQP